MYIVRNNIVKHNFVYAALSFEIKVQKAARDKWKEFQASIVWTTMCR